jgi:ADP-heptose:LPS heptosyltransferase
MNFPGLQPAWNTSHRLMHSGGLIHPWSLNEARSALDHGAHLLVVASTALGDSLLCTPLLQTLAERLSSSRVHFLVREAYAELYRDTPWIGRVLTSRGKFRGFGSIRCALKNQPCTIALIANCTEPDTVPWLWWCGVRAFLRYHTRWSHWADWFANRDAMRPKGDPLYATCHAIENNLGMASDLGIKPSCNLLKVAEFPSVLERLQERLPTTDTPLVLIHPGASRAGKCWPVERWARLADALHAEFRCVFAVTGGRAEQPQAESLCSLIRPNAQNFAGYLNLRELAQLQRRATLFLSGDTGPYHLALAVGCPTVTLFAPRDRGSSIEACGPHLASPEKHRALQTPAFNTPIESIQLEHVLNEARGILLNVLPMK